MARPKTPLRASIWLGVRITPQMRAALEAAAKRSGRTLTEEAREALRRYLTREAAENTS